MHPKLTAFAEDAVAAHSSATDSTCRNFIQIRAEANYINSMSSDSSRRQQVQEYFPAWQTINR